MVGGRKQAERGTEKQGQRVREGERCLIRIVGSKSGRERRKK